MRVNVLETHPVDVEHDVREDVICVKRLFHVFGVADTGIDSKSDGVYVHFHGFKKCNCTSQSVALSRDTAEGLLASLRESAA